MTTFDEHSAAASPHSVHEPTGAVLTLREDLVFVPQEFDGRSCYVIEDPLRSKFFRVGLVEHTFLSLLDGRTSIAEALGLAAAKLGPQAMTEQEALSLCQWLVENELAETAGSMANDRLLATAERKQRQRLRAALNPLQIRLPLWNPDRWLTRVTPWCGWLFGIKFGLLWLALVACGVCLVARHLQQYTAETASIIEPSHWLALGGIWLALKVAHELSHALACKRFGGRVTRAGVQFLLLAPVAFVDVTSSWRFRSKWPRIVTAAAGMYIELLAAALAAVVWTQVETGWAHHFARDVILLAGISTVVFNGNPLMRFDGYYMLADWLEVTNLGSSGRQYATCLLERYVLGRAVTCPQWPGRQQRTIKIYGVAAAIWQVSFAATLCLGLVAWLSYAGAILATGILLAWYGMPLFKLLRGSQSARGRIQSQSSLWRRWGVPSAWVCGLALTVWVLGSQGAAVRAPAVVEYSPLNSVRVRTPGFVRELRVRSGDTVQSGQILAVLENDELRVQLDELNIAFRQSVLKQRVLQQAHELAKLQAECAQQESLERKQRELEKQLAVLLIRAPAAGQVVARGWETLAGQYVQAGQEIAIIGDETAKELVVGVAQEDVELFTGHVQGSVEVRIPSMPHCRFQARLTKLAPQAGVTLPHAALSARVGGPFPVRLQTDNAKASGETNVVYELLTPTFVGTVVLSAEQSRQLASGQLATVRFVSTDQSRATQLVRSVRQWIERKLVLLDQRKVAAGTATYGFNTILPASVPAF